MYLITAYFDEKTNKRIQGWINKIAAETGNIFMTDHKVPPHMTLVSIEARNPEILLPAFYELEGKAAGGEVEIATVGALFPYVLYAAPVPDTYLKELHSQVCDCFSKIPEVSISRYYWTDHWVPHITLGKTLEKEQLRQAFAIMQEFFAPLKGRIVRIALSRVNPHEDLESIWLQK